MEKREVRFSDDFLTIGEAPYCLFFNSILYFYSFLIHKSKMKLKKLEWKLLRKNFLSTFFNTERQLSISITTQEKGNDISSQVNHCGGKMTANFRCYLVGILESSSFPYLQKNTFTYLSNKFSCAHLIDWAKIPSFLCTVTWINFSWCVSWPSWFTEASPSIVIYIFSEYIPVNFKISCLCISLRSTKSKLQSTSKCLCCVETI